MATRNLATGILDIQLMGLPDVKRQLEGIPRLMDGVANAALGVRDKIQRAFEEMNLQQIAARKAEFHRTGVEQPEIQQISNASFTKDFFRKGLDQSFEQSREAITGQQTLEYLAIEKQVVSEIEKELKAKGELDAVNQHIIATERERIRLSEQAINLERQRVLDPAGFDKQRRVQDQFLDIEKKGGDFEELVTQKDAIKNLDAKKAALDKYILSLDEVAGKENKHHVAFIQQSRREIEQADKAIKKRKEIGAKFAEAAASREMLLAKQVSGEKLTRSEANEVDRLSRAMQGYLSDLAKVDAEQNQFNLELHDFGTQSRRANYRAQQLSFAAQDAVQVWGQTGFAGALHASANNLSMFVQTLDVANPKLLAWGAFGVTAGMMALNAWLKNAKDRTDDLVAAISALKDETKDLIANANITVDSGDSRRARQTLMRQEEEARLGGLGVDQQMELVASRLASEGIGQWDRFTYRILTSNEQLFSQAEIARQRFLAGQMSASDMLKVYEKAELLSEEQKSAFHSAAKDAKSIAADLGRSREEARRAAVESVRLGTGSAFRTGMDSFSFGMSELQPVRRPGMDNPLQQMLAAGVEQQRLRDIEALVASFNPEAMTDAERATSDYTSAVRRLTKAHDSGLSLLQKAGATQASILKWEQKYEQTIASVEKQQKSHINQLDRQKKSIIDSVSQQYYWNDQFQQRQRSLDNSYQDLVKRIDESQLPESEKFSQKERLSKAMKEQGDNLQRERDRAILDAKFMGRDGAGDSMIQAQIEETKRAADALLAIEQSTLLTAQEKKDRAAIAQEVHKDNLEGIKDRFQKIGFSDPKSLHRQIQMSLQRPNSEKIMADQLKQQTEMNQHLKAIESKPIFGIGP